MSECKWSSVRAPMYRCTEWNVKYWDREPLFISMQQAWMEMSVMTSLACSQA